MTDSATTYSFRLARHHATGQWSLTTLVVDLFPPMAFPASMSTDDAKAYAHNLIGSAHIPVPPEFDWHESRDYTYLPTGHRPVFDTAWRVSVETLSP